jgi:hypothetical protein
VHGLAIRTHRESSVSIEFEHSVISSVNHPQVLVFGEAKAVRISNVIPLAQIVAIGIEDLNAPIFPIANIDVPAAINDDAIRSRILPCSEFVRIPATATARFCF